MTKNPNPFTSEEPIDFAATARLCAGPPTVASLLIGCRVCVVSQTNDGLWPVKSRVRFVGVVAGYDGAMIAVCGRFQVWSPVPSPTPADWPSTTHEVPNYPMFALWCGTHEESIPDAYGWTPNPGDPDEGTTFFPVASVIVYLAEPAP